MRGAFGVVVVPEPTMFGVGGSTDPCCLALAMLSPLLSEGIAVLEATAVWEAIAILEAWRWHDSQAAPLGWSMAPDPSYLSCLGAWQSPIHKVVGTTCELRLVALNCKRMVDEG